MKKLVIFLCYLLLCSNCSYAKQCFIVKEKDEIIQQDGDCDKRYAPCSTFKIALSLVGYEEKILVDETHPSWPFKKGYSDFLDKWKQDQTPSSWMKNSCVWYSQVLTKKLGMQKLQSYIRKLNYGNMDLSGDKGRNNGLTNSWLSSSLEISSQEQIAFLEKLLAAKLPVSQHAHQMTKNILFVGDLSEGWKLYGKTGSGDLLSPDRAEKLEIQHGWFIGWIEKDGRVIIFLNHIADEKEEDTFASLRAKADAKERLMKIINKLK
jgi:beta-lactamase class D